MPQYIQNSIIRRDGGTQSRVQMNESIVEEYADAMRHGNWVWSAKNAVDVFWDGEYYWLADGFHRCEALARTNEQALIYAEVHKGGLRDALLFSTAVNATHGLRRSRDDLNRAIEVLLRDEEWRAWSNRKIAEHVRCDHKTVGAVRSRLASSGEIPRSDKLIGADGKARPATVEREWTCPGCQTVKDPPMKNPADDTLCTECGMKRDRDVQWLRMPLLARITPSASPPMNADLEMIKQLGLYYHGSYIQIAEDLTANAGDLVHVVSGYFTEAWHDTRAVTDERLSTLLENVAKGRTAAPTGPDDATAAPTGPDDATAAPTGAQPAKVKCRDCNRIGSDDVYLSGRCMFCYHVYRSSDDASPDDALWHYQQAAKLIELAPESDRDLLTSLLPAAPAGAQPPTAEPAALRSSADDQRDYLYTTAERHIRRILKAIPANDRHILCMIMFPGDEIIDGDDAEEVIWEELTSVAFNMSDPDLRKIVELASPTAEPIAA